MKENITTQPDSQAIARPQEKESVRQKLVNLYRLQLVNTKINEIDFLRNELPQRVQLMEDDITGLTVRAKKYEKNIGDLNEQHKDKKAHIANAKKLIKQYEENQKTIKNAREAAAIKSEIEYQELDVQLTEKQIKALLQDVDNFQQKQTHLLQDIQSKTETLEEKKKELNEIMEQIKEEEAMLRELAAQIEETVDVRLLTSYNRIKEKSLNGLVVVPVQRQSSVGSYILIPPQRQIEVANQNKIIIDEHSGRILIDGELAREQEEYIENLIAELKRNK